VFVFRPTRTGSTTQGAYDSTLFLDGSTIGLGSLDLKAIDVPATSSSSSTSSSEMIRISAEVVLADMSFSGPSDSIPLFDAMFVRAEAARARPSGDLRGLAEAVDEIAVRGVAVPIWAQAPEGVDSADRPFLAAPDRDRLADSLFQELGETDGLSCLEALGAPDPGRSLV
jgi:hypothetical protein